MTLKAEVGLAGERRAEAHLTRLGLKVLDRRFRTPTGEIDLIMLEGDTLVFVEVKAREKIHELSALDAMTSAKQKRIVTTALAYLKKTPVEFDEIRFDVVAIDGETLDWIPGAFEPKTSYTY